MTSSLRERELLWQPSERARSESNIAQYCTHLASSRVGSFEDYPSLWAWSVSDLEGFWGSIWNYFQVSATTPYSKVVDDLAMPGAQWFEGSRLNFAEHLTRWASPTRPAIVHVGEGRELDRLSWADLIAQAGAVAEVLREAGVRAGDRVVSTLPNVPEAVVAFIATASIGAIWSSTSPELGRGALLDRFAQIDPKFLFACDGYQFGGRTYDRVEVTEQLQQSLTNLRGTILVRVLGSSRGPLGKDVQLWEEVVRRSAPLTFEPVPFDHPLWIVYTSGTTGLPKAIVHSHGGILVERLKAAGLHLDIKPGDVFFWYTTTAWIMWNIVVSTLANGATIVLYDGSPQLGGSETLWRTADRAGATLFGASAGFLENCMREGLRPGRSYDFESLRTVGSTAAPLSADGFRWVYENVKADVLLASASGGTDVATAFVGSCPILPVYAGEIQCRCLGVDARAVDEQGRTVVDQPGELVIARPMPSMPLGFWGDENNERYFASYFSKYPGMWCHGDLIRISPDGYSTITGRSDATLNRRGVRIGTSEIYRVVEALDEIAESLVVDVGTPSGGSRIELFVVPMRDVPLDGALEQLIRDAIRAELSPRHVPDGIRAIDEVPRSLNGKKLEVPVKRLLMGTPLEAAVDPGAVANLPALQAFCELRESS